MTPLLGFEIARAVGAVRGALWGLTQQIAVENGKGWQSGDRYATGLDVGGKVGRGVALRGGVELQAETAERWHGLALADDVWLDVGLKATLYRHTVGADVSQPLLATVALSWRLPTTAAARAADAAAHTAAEERALAAANVDVRGAPVSWDGADLADRGWCAPCGELDRRLAPRHFGLPHVLVLAPDGRVLYEASGDPAQHVAAITRLLGP